MMYHFFIVYHPTLGITIDHAVNNPSGYKALHAEANNHYVGYVQSTYDACIPTLRRVMFERHNIHIPMDIVIIDMRPTSGLKLRPVE